MDVPSVSSGTVGLIVPLYTHPTTGKLLCARPLPRDVLMWPPSVAAARPRILALPEFTFRVHVKVTFVDGPPRHDMTETIGTLGRHLTVLYRSRMIPNRLSVTSTQRELVRNVADTELDAMWSSPARVARATRARALLADLDATYSETFRTTLHSIVNARTVVCTITGRHHVATLLFLEWLYGQSAGSVYGIREFATDTWMFDQRVRLQLVQNDAARVGRLETTLKLGEPLVPHLRKWLVACSLPMQRDGIREAHVIPASQWPIGTLGEYWDATSATDDPTTGAVVISSHVPECIRDIRPIEEEEEEEEGSADAVGEGTLVLNDDDVRATGVFLGEQYMHGCALELVMRRRETAVGDNNTDVGVAPRPRPTTVTSHRIRPSIKRSLDEVAARETARPEKRLRLLAGTLQYRVFVTKMSSARTRTDVTHLLDSATDDIILAWLVRGDGVVVASLRQHDLVAYAIAYLHGRYGEDSRQYHAVVKMLRPPPPGM